jgi:hypothetical protein
MIPLGQSKIKAPAISNNTRDFLFVVLTCVAGSVDALECFRTRRCLAIATLLGTTGPAAVLPFGLWFFLLSYMRVYRDAIPIVFVASIVFSAGVGFPDGSGAAALDRFWLLLGGGAAASPSI